MVMDSMKDKVKKSALELAKAGKLNNALRELTYYEMLCVGKEDVEALKNEVELAYLASQASPVEVATKALAHAVEMIRQVTEIVTLTMPLGRMSLDKRDEAFELIYKTASQLGAPNIEARSTGYMQDSDVNVSVGIRDVEQIVWDALGELSPTEKRAIIDSNRKFQNS